MGGFLGAFVVASCITAGICVWVVARQCGRSFGDVWGALLEAIKVSLVSGVLVASVPALIEALSARLGLRRSLVEFTLPSAPLFFRGGEVVLLAVMAVFCFGMYGRSLGFPDIVMICLLAPAGAFLAIGLLGPAMITAGSAVLVYLDVPVETVLPGIILLDVVTIGLRNTVSALVSCAVVACVSHGLELESIEAASNSEAETLYFVLSRRQLMAGVGLLLVAMVFTVFAGIGAGMQGATRAPVTRSPVVLMDERLH
jgi:Na+/H+-dicarboxylate symporter